MKSWSKPSRPVILHLTPNQEMTRTQTSKRSAHLILEDAVSALGLIQRFCLPRILSEREQDIRSDPTSLPSQSVPRPLLPAKSNGDTTPAF